MKQTPLYPFQLKGVRKVRDFGIRAIIGDAMGLGKSLMTLYIIWKYLPDDPPGPVVIVCPASIKTNWQREAARHLGMEITVLDGRTARPEEVPDRPNQVLVLNYDILGRAKDAGSWVSFVKKQRPRLVVGDEAHYLKNRSAQRTRAFRALCEGVPHVLLLTGTPIVNRPAEFWSLLNIVRPDLYPSFYAFAARHCQPTLRPWGMTYTGAARLKELHRDAVASCLIRRRKEDVLDQLPPKVRTVIPVPVSDRTEYDQAVNQFLVWLEREAPGMGARAMRAEQLVKLGHLKRLAGRLKLRAVTAWVADFLAAEEKLILYGLHQRVLLPLHGAFRDRAVLIDGSVTGARRQAAFDRFNADPGVRLLVGHMDAAGVGWSCTGTSHVAFAELAWTPGQHAQCEDRVRGIGRGTGGSAFAYYLVSEGTIETELCRVLEEKQRVFDRAVDGRVTPGGIDVHTRLADYLKTHQPPTRRIPHA